MTETELLEELDGCSCDDYASPECARCTEIRKELARLREEKIMTTRMNPEVKAQWLQALRSGEYAQTDGCLHNRYGFCCLGVLCDLHAKEADTTWQEMEDLYPLRYCKCETLLPEVVCKWAGLPVDPGDRYGEYDVTLKTPARLRSDPNYVETATLSELNDDHCLSFAEIADVIEEQL
jgi:hypothetical protein